MVRTVCVVCRKKTPIKVLYKANFHPRDINPETYTSRRIPDRVHFRIVRCKICGLTFSNPISSVAKIIAAYQKSANPTHDDLKNSAKVYTSIISGLIKNLPSKNRILDIGCGDGFFLLEAKKLGFKELYGIEPSQGAVSRLPKALDKKNIINDVFKKGQFRKNFFDLICFFQVLDHVIDPNEFLRNCYVLLKPGGYVAAIMHDAGSLTNKFLGEKSPIIDIQHIYLFDRRTVKRIFKRNSFIVESVFNISNNYSLGYWLEMAPLPKFLHKVIVENKKLPIFKISIPLKVGNMAIIAKKS